MGQYFIDGNNLKEYMARVGLLHSADDALLVAWLQRWATQSGAKRRKQHRVDVYFDAGPQGRHPSQGNVRVRVAPPGITADEAIVRELSRIPARGGQRDATLVTSDRALTERAQALGVRVVDCAQFAGRSREAAPKVDEAQEKVEAEKRLGRALDAYFLPPDERKAPAKPSPARARISPSKVSQMRDPARLVDLLRRGDRVIRRRAVLALGVVGTDKARQVLEEVLVGDPVPSVRAAAAEALGSLGDVQSARALERAAADRFPLVRAAVARALRRCGDERSAATLARLAQDPHRRVRRAASGEVERPARS
ncbi:MAG: hypothetical protein Kow00123_14600 [Anaerolineales bacterium]